MSELIELIDRLVVPPQTTAVLITRVRATLHSIKVPHLSAAYTV